QPGPHAALGVHFPGTPLVFARHVRHGRSTGCVHVDPACADESRVPCRAPVAASRNGGDGCGVGAPCAPVPGRPREPMKALIVTTSEERLRTDVLGTPLGVRAVFQAVDAGATSVEIAGAAAGALLHMLAGYPLPGPVTPYRDSRDERLVIQADALIAPELLRRLRPSQALQSEDGHLVAARTVFMPGHKASTPLAGLPFLDYAPSPWAFALHLHGPE